MSSHPTQEPHEALHIPFPERVGKGPSLWGCKVQPDRNRRIPWKLEARAGAGCSLIGSSSAKDRPGSVCALQEPHSAFHGSSLAPANTGSPRTLAPEVSGSAQGISNLIPASPPNHLVTEGTAQRSHVSVLEAGPNFLQTPWLALQVDTDLLAMYRKTCIPGRTLQHCLLMELPTHLLSGMCQENQERAS